MNCTEFLSAMQSRGATIIPPTAPGQIEITNTILRSKHMAMLPAFLSELYTHTGGINLGNGYILGPLGAEFPGIPAPDIITLNDGISGIEQIRGKTVFGRNDLFWFAFDVFGKCYMLNNLTLSIMRQYDDPYRALSDCLIAGKF